MAPTEFQRPRVVISSTMSLDGRITVGPHRLLLDPTASEPWHSLHPPSSDRVLAARAALIERTHHPTAVLEGSGSFVTPDSPPLHPPDPHGDPPDDFVPPEIAERAEHRSWFTVIDSRGRVDWTMTGEGGTDLLILVARRTPPGYLADLRRKRVCHLVAGEREVDLPLALDRLRDRLGVKSVAAEAGGARSQRPFLRIPSSTSCTSSSCPS